MHSHHVSPHLLLLEANAVRKRTLQPHVAMIMIFTIVSSGGGYRHMILPAHFLLALAVGNLPLYTDPLSQPHQGVLWAAGCREAHDGCTAG